MHEIKISNGYIQLWASYLKEIEIDPLSAPFLQDLQPQISRLIDQPFDTQVPLVLLNEVIQRTKQALDCPELIFKIVQSIRPEHFGVLGYMVSRSRNIPEMIGYIMRFQRLVIDGQAFVPLQLRQHKQSIELHWHFLHEKYNLLNELTLAAMVQLGRYILQGQRLPLFAVRLAHQSDIPSVHFHRFFGLEAKFNQVDYGVELTLDALNLNTHQSDPMLLKLLVRQAEEAIASKPQIENLMQMAQHEIANHFRVHQQALQIEAVAQSFYMSVRSLQRGLSEQGTSFKKLLENERMQRCEQLLMQEMSLSDIASKLDYSDQSALARAYKAHTGRTLLATRKRIKSI